MKSKNILRSKGTFFYLVVSTFTILSITPLKAQVVRDQRTKKTNTKTKSKIRDQRNKEPEKTTVIDGTNIPDVQYETYVKRPDLRESSKNKVIWRLNDSDNSTDKKNRKVRDHRTSNKSIDKNQTLNFDEADAIFGTRTELQRKYPELRFTGKIDQIMITKKLSDGENSIHKTESGNTIYATVKKGKITRLSLRNPKIKDIKDGTSNTVVYNDNNSTCFWCTKICHDPDGAGVDTCWTTCVVVDCSKAHNAVIPGKIVKGN